MSFTFQHYVHTHAHMLRISIRGEARQAYLYMWQSTTSIYWFKLIGSTSKMNLLMATISFSGDILINNEDDGQ